MRIRLIVASGRGIGKPIEVSAAEYFIGRDPGCHLRPNSQSVSRKHAAIMQRDGGVFLRDLGTTNGTQHNDRLLHGEEVEVGNGDLLGIGPLHFRFAIEAPRWAPSPVAAAAGDSTARHLLEAGVEEFEEEPTSFFDPLHDTTESAPPDPAAKANGTAEQAVRLPQLSYEVVLGSVLVLSVLARELDDEATVSPIRYGLASLLSMKLPRRMVVRLDQVRVLSPRAQGMILGYAQRLRRAGGAMRLCGVREELVGDLEHALKGATVGIYDSVEKAVHDLWP